MKRIRYIATAFVVVSLFVLLARLGTNGQAQSATPAAGANVIVRVPSPKEPVEITKLLVTGNQVISNIPFVGDENWVNALSCEVKNTSGKTITELRMSVSFEANSDKHRRIHIPLIYSAAVQPNRSVQVSAPTASVASLRDLLAKQGAAANFRKGELRLQIAKFEDGSIWVKGVTLGSPDPRTGRRKRM
ncbi:MAG: hypothetical protein ACR2H4_12315 [Pyrinomonadaceae bacterium]|nr:hypothetical protein [Blastocatellia bacterium]